MIEPGDKVKCLITGFSGTVVAVTKFINGCEQAEVIGKVQKDGKYPEPMGIDIQSLKITKKKAVDIQEDETGGQSKINRPMRGF